MGIFTVPQAAFNEKELLDFVTRYLGGCGRLMFGLQLGQEQGFVGFHDEAPIGCLVMPDTKKTSAMGRGTTSHRATFL